MAHLTDGMLRALVDGQLEQADRTRAERHLSACADCRGRLAAATADRDWLAGAMQTAQRDAATLPLAPGSAWRRLRAVAGRRGGGGVGRAEAPAAAAVDVLAGRRAGRPLARVVAAAAALAVAAAFALPPVRAAAGNFLSIFRADKIQTITVSPNDMAQIEQALASGAGSVKVGDLATIRVQPPHPVPATVSLGEARRMVDFPLQTPTALPPGYSLQSVQVVPAVTVGMTLHRAAIDQVLARLGNSGGLPASIDGKLIRLETGDAVAIRYTAQSGGARLLVAESPSPTLRVPAGVDAAAVRQALLQLPFLPPDVRAQLAAVANWQQTAIVPQIPGVSQSVSVGGDPGVFIRPRQAGGSSSLVWIAGGIVHVVSGPLSLAQAQAVAASMVH